MYIIYRVYGVAKCQCRLKFVHHSIKHIYRLEYSHGSDLNVINRLCHKQSNVPVHPCIITLSIRDVSHSTVMDVTSSRTVTSRDASVVTVQFRHFSNLLTSVRPQIRTPPECLTAIECESTMIRIGSTIFGKRDYPAATTESVDQNQAETLEQ